jgi:hypothetical protein
MPLILKPILRKDDSACFWYAMGNYPKEYTEYPTAGIESITAFSGRPSLRANNSRSHIIGIGYDSVRTQAIASIVDPSRIAACLAFPSFASSIRTNIEDVNSITLAKSALVLALHIDNFSLMLSEICDTTSMLMCNGDVILIPDGPKPLILAMSMVPSIINKEGVSCLFVSRNATHFEPIDVEPVDKVYGFTLSKQE